MMSRVTSAKIYVMNLTDDRARARLNTTAALYALGVSIQREKLRQAHPSASRMQIEHLLREWLGHGGFDEPDPPLIARAPRAIPVSRG
jgi:hypothetical protein